MNIQRPDIPIPITYTGATAQTCDPDVATRKLFSSGNIRLTVPSYQEDNYIRWMIDKGARLADAYKEAGAYDIYPDPAIRPCIRQVFFNTKYFDAQSQSFKHAAGNNTCHEYWKCFQEYLYGYRDLPIIEVLDRHMRLAPGVYTPSPNQEACIRKNFQMSGELKSAYYACGCPEIYPWWPSGPEVVAQALQNNPVVNMYNAIKDAYKLYTESPDFLRYLGFNVPLTTPATMPPEAPDLPYLPPDLAAPISPTFTWIVAGLAAVTLYLLIG